MAKIQVILLGGLGGTAHDTESYPVILRFSDERMYDEAEWIIPSYPGYIPGPMLSEIRVEQGPLHIVIEGPEGFQSGPHEADWVRSNYPSGQDCSFIKMNPEDRTTMKGVMVSVIEGALVVNPLAVGRGPSSAGT